MTYFSNVVINVDKQYSQSYGNSVDENYDFAIVEKNWIELFNECGFSQGRKMLSGKHFHNYTGKQITERTFKMRTKKASILLVNKIAAKKQAEAEKQAKYEKYCNQLISDLPVKIYEVSKKLNSIITVRDLDARAMGDMSKNELCNKAVGIVGYHFAKHLGWMFVLNRIRKFVNY